MDRPSSEFPPLHNRVLVVDDDRAARETAAALLEDSYVVVTAEDGPSALKVLERREIDVICTDYEMPGMTGRELLNLVHSRFPCVAGVLMTGHREYLSTPPSYGRGYVFDIVLKPFDPANLMRTIDRALDRARVARELQRRAARAR